MRVTFTGVAFPSSVYTGTDCETGNVIRVTIGGRVDVSDAMGDYLLTTFGPSFAIDSGGQPPKPPRPIADKDATSKRRGRRPFLRK